MTQPEHLNAQQVQAIEGKVRAAVQAYIREMDLRKWSMERASEIVLEGDLNPGQIVQMAQGIYDFVTQPDRTLTVELR